MKIKTTIILVCLLFVASAAMADTDPWLLPTLTGATGVGTPINAGANNVTLGTGAFLYNNTTDTFTDLTATWTNPASGALYSNYACLNGSASGGGNAFASCTGPNTSNTWTWHFSGIDATHPGIAPTFTFALQFIGNQDPLAQFTITPSFTPAVPEPATLALFSTGLAALARVVRKRRQ